MVENLIGGLGPVDTTIPFAGRWCMARVDGLDGPAEGPYKAQPQGAGTHGSAHKEQGPS